MLAFISEKRGRGGGKGGRDDCVYVCIFMIGLFL